VSDDVRPPPRPAGHRKNCACAGGVGGTGFRAGAPTVAEVLGGACLVAWSLVISAARLSTLCRTTARPREIATSGSRETLAAGACAACAAGGANQPRRGDKFAIACLPASP